MTMPISWAPADPMEPITYSPCNVCPRECGVDRNSGPSFCGVLAELMAAKAMIHKGEEPCLIGIKENESKTFDPQTGEGRFGAGAVFFSGCNLRCVFCQNHQISGEAYGKVISKERLCEILLELQEEGAACIDLVTPTHYLPTVAKVLAQVKPKLVIPVVYNCGGYEKVESLRMLEGLVDIYLPDLKYYSRELSGRYSAAPDYFEKASEALKEMFRQTGPCSFDQDGQMKKGVLVRHLVLPGASHDSEKLMDFLGTEFPKGTVHVSLLRQYTPYASVNDYPEIDRRITGLEYERVVDRALSNGLPGFRQGKSAATMELLPTFDLSGL